MEMKLKPFLPQMLCIQVGCIYVIVLINHVQKCLVLNVISRNSEITSQGSTGIKLMLLKRVTGDSALLLM